MGFKTKTDSPYEYIEGLSLEYAPAASGWQQETDLAKLFKDGIYGRAEHCVLDALYKYPFLNFRTLSRYLDIVYGTHGTPNWYHHILLKMRGDNIIYALRYGDNVFYALQDYVRLFWVNKKRYSVSIPDICVSAVLEYASLAQWHISMMEGEKLVKNTLYQNMKIAGETLVVPSYMEIVKSDTRYRIFSFAFPKGVKEISPFIALLSHMWELMARSRRKNMVTLTVLTVSSLKEMEVANGVFKSCKTAKGHRIYYVLDGNTSEFSGLECLYYYIEEEGEYQLKTIDVR